LIVTILPTLLISDESAPLGWLATDCSGTVLLFVRYLVISHGQGCPVTLRRAITMPRARNDLGGVLPASCCSHLAAAWFFEIGLSLTGNIGYL